MIKNDALSNKLNSYKKGEKSPIPAKYSIFSPLINFFNTLLDLGITIALAIIYGYAIKVIFATDWKFLAMIVVGYVAENMITRIVKLFSKN